MNKKKTPEFVLFVCFSLWFLIFPLVIGIKLYKTNVAIDKELAEQLNTLEFQIDSLNKSKEQCQKEFDEISKNKADLLEKMQHEAEEKAEKEMEIKLESAKETLEHLNQDIETKELLLDEKNSEYEKSIKAVESNAKKVDKLKEIYKSFQYAIKAYESGSDSQLNEALIAVADETLLPIVEMKLNCMNVKQLKSKYNQLQRDIQDSFKRYEGRYNTKSNIAIYKLMVIALEAELQNVLYSLKYGKLEDSVDSVKEITSRYLSIAVDGNQSIAPTMKKFIGEIEYLFIEAVKVEYEYYTRNEEVVGSSPIFSST